MEWRLRGQVTFPKSQSEQIGKAQGGALAVKVVPEEAVKHKPGFGSDIRE